MQAICTKYLGPTDFRGARIKAYCGDGRSTTIPYPYTLSGQNVHFKAVIAFCSKFPGWGPADAYHAGIIKGGYAWVNPHR